MDKRKGYEVKSENELLDFLLENIKGMSRNNIKSLLTKKKILVDGKVETKHNYVLSVGQFVSISDAKNTDVVCPFDILYEDDEIIVINKPQGLLSIATNKEKDMTAYHILMEYVQVRNPKNRVYIVHRLDKDTSGVLIFAKNEKIKLAFQENWNENVKRRGYLAIVEGKLKQSEGVYKSYLKETKTQLVYSSSRAGDGLEAITEYKVVRCNSKYSLVQVNLLTGRKNQIRVHMQDLGNPIVGDKKYGATSNPINRLGLHANIIEVVHPFTKKLLKFEAPIPKAFKFLVKEGK